MCRFSHFVVNDFYLKEVKVRTTVLFWTVPKKFDDEEVNDNICTGHKEIHIFHKLNAGYYCQSDCKRCRDDFPIPCSDEIIGFVRKLYPDYDFFGNKEALKKYYRRKKCVDADECQKEKSQEER